MTTAQETKTVFAAEHDVPIPYMQRTRDYYQALGFSPYRWAHHIDAPFTPLRTPLARARVALITTAAPFQPELGELLGGQLRQIEVVELPGGVRGPPERRLHGGPGGGRALEEL